MTSLDDAVQAAVAASGTHHETFQAVLGTARNAGRQPASGAIDTEAAYRMADAAYQQGLYAGRVAAGAAVLASLVPLVKSLNDRMRDDRPPSRPDCSECGGSGSVIEPDRLDSARDRVGPCLTCAGNPGTEEHQ